ncbi:MAG: outer membrane protein assembly factor BamD [Gammaproteobacteria bacterium]|nr:outer membrane protein assembly factor BamD [Gammaproteobacteria bacterium]MDH3856949.1 outer membrane protein assembly factor BamD [Gammaproteobacteria bacterium]
MRFITYTLLALSLVACGTAKEEIDPTAEWNAERFYLEARAELNKGNYLTSIEYYETLESRYPFGKHATQAQIDVAYAYYKFNEPDSAITAIDRFIKLHPRNPAVDYAYYLKGLVNFERGGTILDVLSERDLSEFDKSLLLTAYNDFRLLVQRFPDSIYAEDSGRRMIFLRNELARADFRVASYYATRDAWVAVANRTRFILQNYQGASVIKSTLELQLKAYQALELDELARDTQRIIDLNYNQDS